MFYFWLQKIYKKNAKENKNFQLLIENNIKIFEEKYESDYNIIKNEYTNLLKNEGEQENKYLKNHRKHCFYDNEIANHNCQNNSKYILISIKDKDKN